MTAALGRELGLPLAESHAALAGKKIR